jgi:hypothetical protein
MLYAFGCLAHTVMYLDVAVLLQALMMMGRQRPATQQTKR